MAKDYISWAKEKELATLGYAPCPPGQEQEKLLTNMNELRRFARSIMVMLETCTKCGACAQQCHSYLGTGDYHNIPAARADLFRRLYKRYFTLSGRVLGRFIGAQDYDAETLGKWATYFYQCNECRRCARFCPFGIDTAEVTIAARMILTKLGIVPRFYLGIGHNMVVTGNNMGIPKPALLDCTEFLEDEIQEETGVAVKIPVDKPDADILYIPSSADFFTNTDTMIGAAKLFHALGANWTIASDIIEAGNFGLFFDYDLMKAHNKRLYDAAAAYGAKLVLQGECGHGWRAAKMYTEGLNGPTPFALRHVLEYAAENLGRLQLQRQEIRVTLQDPCNVARAGDIIEQPRDIIKACVTDFVEMTPNRENNYCCGGGSGLLMDEFYDTRMKLGKIKADQVRPLHAEYLAVPCSICKAQLPLVLQHYDMGHIKTGGVLDLLGKALVLT